ncbi:uncharacterized protein EV154DRAFT_490543 [Mucor mucedo]|uniref:uncharacterized protein n=1 Tax=Mucor mucedo TaxID=29922 RepID=UPI00222094D4|nr:uncharacterized protein EV154DRAFT_490543 [Mucor mucedo]KAI7897129.1 hypothetical protein EV154DRAFT_490543 [Mucor mucedo]
MPLVNTTNNTSDKVIKRNKRLTDLELDQVIAHYENGLKAVAIGKLVNRPRTTIASVISLYKKTGSPKGKPSTGRPKKLSKTSVRALKRSVRANPHEPYEFHREALAHAGVHVSKETILKTLKDEGFGFFSAIKKSALTDEQRK